jgi:CDP-4-dehydro-6-deoxyglucose reductase/ferredoxin-NAD(P)+ reductase (naphthalene dioxygenase ferredoxin-specific)
MTFTVAIAQHATPIQVEPGATVLETALAAGVPYPHGCRSGNCGACKSKLIAGEIEMLPHSEYALSEAERASGLILACRAMPWSDARVAWLDTDEIVAHPVRHLTCRVAALEPLTHDTMRVALAIEAGGPFDFSPGQYASLSFPGQAARDYSMANAPGAATLDFFIRRMPQGRTSAHVAERLRVDDVVRVEGPFGAAFLREQHTGPILAIAGGSGIAPVKAIVERALALDMKQPIQLYFGVQDERDLYLEAHFASLAARHPQFHFIPVLSAPSRATQRRTGFVHEAVATDFADCDGCKAYLAGPPVMVEAATAMLAARGLRRVDIHADAFYTEAEKQALMIAAEGT